MRTTIAALGLVAVASAGQYTETKTVDVTITSCSPKYTECPTKPEQPAGGNAQWEDWSEWTTTVEPAKSTETWADWSTTEEPAKSTGTWADWSSVKEPAKSTETWGDWSTAKTGDNGKATETWGDWATVTKPTGGVSTVTGAWADWASAGNNNGGKASESWGDWSTVTKPTGGVSTVTGSWADWSATASPACPAYTASGPPAWFKDLPSDVHSSMAAKWTGAPPADWCYYTYSTAGPTGTASTATGTWADWNAASTGSAGAASGTWADWNAASAAGATGAAGASGSWADWKGASATTPVLPQWTGAAVAKAGSIVAAGLAAAAALVVV